MKDTDHLTPHFTYGEMTFSEIGTRNGVDNTPNAEQLANLKKTAEGMELVRALLGKSINVNSGFRGPVVNKLVGSTAKHSPHLDGWACDFTCKEFGTPKQIAIAIRDSNIKFDKLIYEGTWCHISFDPQMRRECLTAVFKPKQPVSYLPGIVDPH